MAWHVNKMYSHNLYRGGYLDKSQYESYEGL